MCIEDAFSSKGKYSSHKGILRYVSRRIRAGIVRHPENETVPGLLIFRLDAPIFFANDEPLRDRIKELVRTTEPKTRAVLLDMEVSSNLDLSSADMLGELAGELKAEGVELLLANVRALIRDLLRRSGVAQTIGEEHIYPSIEEGVEAFKRAGVR